MLRIRWLLAPERFAVLLLTSFLGGVLSAEEAGNGSGKEQRPVVAPEVPATPSSGAGASHSSSRVEMKVVPGSGSQVFSITHSALITTPGGAASIASHPVGLPEARSGAPVLFLARQLDSLLGTPALPTLLELDFAAAERLVKQVPVGGVDHRQEGQRGWRVEQVVPVTPEQGEALAGLRKDYARELAALAEELRAYQLKMVERVVALRQGFEQRADEVLTAEARVEKKLLDAAARRQGELERGAAERQGAAIRACLEELGKAAAGPVPDGIGDGQKALMGKGQALLLKVRGEVSQSRVEYLKSIPGLLQDGSRTRVEGLLQELQAVRNQNQEGQLPVRRPSSGASAAPSSSVPAPPAVAPRPKPQPPPAPPAGEDKF